MSAAAWLHVAPDVVGALRGRMDWGERCRNDGLESSRFDEDHRLTNSKRWGNLKHKLREGNHTQARRSQMITGNSSSSPQG